LIATTTVFMFDSDLAVLVGSMPINFYGSLEKNGLLAIPLFMLVGEIMNRGGLTQRLTAAADVLVGSFRGGMAYVNLLANAMAASILGSAIAQISVMSKVMIPQMEERGYSKGFAAALTTSGGLLGPIIPPSMLMIIYGVIAYQPIAALFIAGILPGLIIFSSFAVTHMVVGIFHELPKEKRQSWSQSRSRLISGLVPGLVPLVITAGIISGAMTPTESGAVAAFIAFALGFFVYRNLRLKDLPEILQSVALTTAVITGLIASASVFGWALSFEGVPDRMVEALTAMTDSPLVFLLLVNIIIILLGMFLETISVMIVLVPILLPAVEAMNINLIHFGVVVAVGTVIGLVTPPVGPGLYVAMLQADVKLKDIVLWSIPFFIALIVSMIFINAFPVFSIWLPTLFGLLN